MANQEKATAVVVRGTDWSETSRIATLFTREHGKVRVLAKGGRRLRSNFEIALDLLTVCHVVYLKKAHGGLDLLTEAQVAERFPALRTRLPALYAGYYVAELLADGTQDYDPHPSLFAAAVAALRDFAGPEPVAPADLPDRVSRFELAWLQELGYGPRIDACAGCGLDLPGVPAANDRFGFAPAAGGALCPGCRPAHRDARPLSGLGLTGLRAVAVGGEVSPPARREVRQTLGLAVSWVLGRRPRMLGYIDGG